MSDGKGPQAIHLVQIRDGKLLSDGDVEPLLYSYKLTRKNELEEEGIPRKPSENEQARWNASFAEKVVSENTPAVEWKANKYTKSETLAYINGEQIGGISRARSPGTSDWGWRGFLSQELHFTPEKAIEAEERAVLKHYANMRAVATMEEPRKVGAGETATDKDSLTAEKPVQQIEDFGEKIGGARKDVWSGFKDQIDEIPDDKIANQPFSKVWPAPDYQAMLDSGADPWSVAFMHAARDEVPAKPRAPYKVKRWAESVKLLRGMTTKILSGEYSVETVREKLSEQKNGLQKLASRVELYELVGHSKSLEGISFPSHDNEAVLLFAQFLPNGFD